MRIGLDGEFGLINSTSAQSIEKGIRIALAEINGKGGVLGGRPLELVIRDNRSVPARGIENLREFAKDPDLVAVFCGRFSTVVLEQIPLIHDLKIILLNPWASADGITNHGFQPSYTFRLSLKDSLAMPFMMRQARQRGFTKLGLLLPNTGWGRSNQAAAVAHASANPVPQLVGQAWYNWGDRSLAAPYSQLLQAGAEAILFVANDLEATALLKDLEMMPAAQRRPLIAHWGITGGSFVKEVGALLGSVDLTVIQTFSFLATPDSPAARRVLAGGAGFGWKSFEDIPSPVGVAQAYDLTHILARAIDLAGTADRSKVRDALEKVRDYAGLMRHYERPFTADSHDALGPNELLMARFRKDGVIIPLAANR
ncbi:MAG: ABC transporter substrate-binding protein [Rhodospirillales bacterium]|nr:ABC transporter substrate-binding protein [Rhodospirillales bacterium]